MIIRKFGTGSCGPCKVQDKELDKIKNIDIIKYDIDDDSDESNNAISKYNIRNIPLTILFNDECEEIKRWTGLVKASEILQYIQ